ncbi:serine/threonine-protein kinase [Sphingomonas sp. PAMC 26605]|uniref:serine/threonine-protein kinase n=1 Tax=Sphingomonas sp. PAMC 26605 TaxID=1112214 RepID=UPI00026CABFC|nr:serine/threonine-protein kinase [Sphingomonas sp. PAMC 26605]
MVDTLEPGGMVADYRIDTVLGSGSFGVTYRAHDVALARSVAIKEYMPVDYARRDATGAVISRNAEATPTFAWGLDRFTDEARTLAQFNHPNIVRVVRLVTGVNGTAYIVMELLDGINLETLVERDGPLDPAVFLSVFRQILDGVAAIHALGILHRDIKPANIVIKGETPVLIDFGAARDLATQRKAGFSALVTDGYSPLEQYSREREQNAASDIYALAATGYFLLTARIPPSSAARSAGDALEPIATALHGKLPADVLAAIDAGLALKADDRPQTIDAWLKMMPSLAEAKDIPVVVDATGRRVNRRAILIAGAGLVLAGGASAVLWTRDTAVNASARPLKAGWSKVIAPLYNEPYGAIVATADAALVAAHRLQDGTEHMLALRIGDDGGARGSFVLDRPSSRAHAILPMADGGALVGGEVDGQAALVRLDRDWRQLWLRSYQAGSISSIMNHADGVIAGLEGPESSGSAKLLFLDPAGALQSDVTLLDRQGDSVQRIVQLGDGAIIVLGQRLETRTIGGAAREGASLWVAEVAATGQEQWRVAETGLGVAQGWDLIEAGGDIFVTGRTSSDGAAHRLLLMRLDRQGKKIWRRWDYSGAPSSGRGFATLGEHSPALYLAGWAGDPRHRRISQIAADGTLVWDDLDATPAGAGGSGSGIALRPDGTGFLLGLATQGANDLVLTLGRLQ